MKVSYEPGVSQVWLNTTINMRANFGLVLIATKIIITTVMILQVVLDGLEDRGHKVDKVDKFGSVVVAIGDCHHHHHHHIVSLVDKLCGGWNWSLPSFSQHCHFSKKKSSFISRAERGGRAWSKCWFQKSWCCCWLLESILEGNALWKTLSLWLLEFKRNSRIKFQPQSSLVRCGFQKIVTLDLRWNSTCHLCWQKRWFSASIYYTKEINATISSVCLNQSVYAARSSFM